MCRILVLSLGGLDMEYGLQPENFGSLSEVLEDMRGHVRHALGAAANYLSGVVQPLDESLGIVYADDANKEKEEKEEESDTMRRLREERQQTACRSCHGTGCKVCHPNVQ